MKTKLTLSIEKQVIEEAKAIAKEEGTTLSAMAEGFLKQYISKQRHQSFVREAETEYGRELSPEVVRKLKEVEDLAGIFYTPGQDKRDYKEILQEELIKRRNRLNKQ